MSDKISNFKDLIAGELDYLPNNIREKINESIDHLTRMTYMLRKKI